MKKNLYVLILTFLFLTTSIKGTTSIPFDIEVPLETYSDFDDTFNNPKGKL